jgi:SMC interacting uncharacterized protein involved in chromosome segregation
MQMKIWGEIKHWIFQKDQVPDEELVFRTVEDELVYLIDSKEKVEEDVLVRTIAHIQFLKKWIRDLTEERDELRADSDQFTELTVQRVEEDYRRHGVIRQLRERIEQRDEFIRGIRSWVHGKLPMYPDADERIESLLSQPRVED